MHIVFLRLSALGDILRVLPAYVNLRDAFPDARIQAVVEDRHAFLLNPFPGFEPVIVQRKRLSGTGALSELKRVAQGIEGADASLDFHGILKSALIARFAKIPERWGDGVTKEFASRLQTHHVPFQLRSRYEQALGLSEAFGLSRGIEGLGVFRPVLQNIQLPDPGRVWEDDGRKRVVLVPGASKRGAVKRWPLDYWMELTGKLKKTHQMRWSLGPEEAELRDWLPAESGVPALPAMKIWELATCIRQADVVVTPDTGLLHLSILLGVKVIALFGPSDPVVAGIPEGSGVLLRTGIECSPCRERQCQRRSCLHQLRPEIVIEKLS